MKTNMKSYPEFYSAVQNNELVYLFGTGISAALTGKPYAWRKWIVDGIAHVKDTALAATYKKSIEDDGSTENMINVVGKVMAVTKADNTYTDWMRESFEVDPVANVSLSSTLRKLLITQDVFATTNYDLLLEQATGLSTLTYDEPDKAFPMLEQRKGDAVLHIHGAYDSIHGIDNIVADKEQYQTVLNDKGAQFIQQILGTRTLIFVGCGKTTEDANIAQFIQFAGTHLHMDRDYYFLYKTGQEPVGMPDNIKRIPYGDNYNDLSDFLEDMALERLKCFAGKNPIVGRTVYQKTGYASEALLKYHYSQEAVSFCGRGEELDQLQEFMKENSSFLWWAITGQAGAGKSRLAFELLRKVPASWFGFFLNDKASISDCNAFQPFTHTLVVIDYVSGREAYVAEMMRKLRKCFEATTYSLRILLIERENNRRTGSWYAKLAQRFGRYDSLAGCGYQEDFLYIEDLDEAAVADFIGGVCGLNGLPADRGRDVVLRDAYKAKLEKLSFRPLFVQIFVEAWIENKFSFPRYDKFEDLLQLLLAKEQEKWLAALEGDQECCNAFIHLLLRANVSGELNTENLPELYQGDWKIISCYISTHSFPGQQRKEEAASIINAVCHNVDGNNYNIVPLFPDIIKEYMFYYYMEDDRLNDVMEEIWQYAAHDFSVFITRCMTDFPDNAFYRKALNVYTESTKNIGMLTGRLELLKSRILKKDDDPRVLVGIIENEYEFWRNISLPERDAPDYEHFAMLKVSGLNCVAQSFGGWSLYDVTRMVEAIDEALTVPGGEGTKWMKQFFLSSHITELSKAGFTQAAAYLREKMDALIADSRDEDWGSLLNMHNQNSAMMEKILAEDFDTAYVILKRMEAECKYSNLEAVRALAHSCFNLDNLALHLGKPEFAAKGVLISEKLELLYPDDWNIRARVLGSRISKLQTGYFTGTIEADKARAELEKLEEKLATMSYGHKESDEALDMVWGLVKTFKLNFISEDEAELGKLIAEADEILRSNPFLDDVVVTKITALHALHKKALKNKVSHDEVEEVFKYVEMNPASAAVRNAFFEMLADSEEANKRENYMTQRVMYGARQDARYNPLMGSGIEEVDEEAELLRYLPEYEVQEPYRRKSRKIGANEPCPCGSGKKFKKCCRGKGKYV